MIFFILIPGISLLLAATGLAADRGNYKKYTFLMALSLAVSAYSFIPESAMDLARHFETMRNLASAAFTDIFDESVADRYLFMQNLVFYLIGKTGNLHLLPAVAIFSTYGCLFYMIADFAERESIPSFVLILCIFFITGVFPMLWELSGIRYYWSAAAILFALYREYIQKKHNILTYMLYILPVFMHYAAGILIIFRLLIPIYKKWGRWIISLILLGWSGIIAILCQSVSKITGSDSYISIFFQRMIAYTNKAANVWDLKVQLENSTVEQLRRVFLITICLLVFWGTFFIFKSSYDSYKKNEGIFSYLRMFCLFSIGSAPFIMLYDRFAYVAVFLSFAAMSVLLKKSSKHPPFTGMICLTLILLAFLGLGYQYLKFRTCTLWLDALI